jgi:hypothetical protein
MNIETFADRRADFERRYVVRPAWSRRRGDLRFPASADLEHGAHCNSLERHPARQGTGRGLVAGGSAPPARAAFETVPPADQQGRWITSGVIVGSVRRWPARRAGLRLPHTDQTVTRSECERSRGVAAGNACGCEVTDQHDEKITVVLIYGRERRARIGGHVMKRCSAGWQPPGLPFVGPQHPTATSRTAAHPCVQPCGGVGTERPLRCRN